MGRPQRRHAPGAAQRAGAGCLAGPTRRQHCPRVAGRWRRCQSVRHQHAAPGHRRGRRAPAVNIDQLRDLYADARMRRAVDEFSARPDPLALRAGNANDLGTIEGLTPLQPYRVAMGNPQVQELQTAVAMKAAGLGIPKVENIGPTENATDNARYRPNART